MSLYSLPSEPTSSSPSVKVLLEDLAAHAMTDTPIKGAMAAP